MDFHNTIQRNVKILLYIIRGNIRFHITRKDSAFELFSFSQFKLSLCQIKGAPSDLGMAMANMMNSRIITLGTHFKR